jgi:cytochrome c oxidase subunit 2
VIHSLWVPALAGKVDMLPGRVHQLRVLADVAGVFRGQCAEFCGEQHARMALQVVALPPAEYERWLDAQARPAASPVDPLAQRGLAVYESARCAACHDIRGLVPGAALGPDLTHVGSRLTIGAGTLANDRDALARWVHRPQAVKPGVRMPSYDHLDEASLQALAAFLEQLR